MELKNAVTVCLISLFSATLVVLIARSLDSDAASRLEPQLIRIVEELEAIRKQREAIDERLIVYYLHGVRCPTCTAAEANAHAVLRERYAVQLDQGRIEWKVLDYTTDRAGKAIAKDLEIDSPAIALVKMKDDQVEDQKRLARILEFAEDRDGMAAYLQSEIDAMLAAPDAEPETPSETQPEPAPEPQPSPDVPDIPLPDTPDIPLPDTETDDLPLP